MPWYATEYEPWPVEPIQVETPVGKYGSFIWASNEREARAFAKRRRIGETVTHVASRTRRPEPLPSELIRRSMSPAQKLNFVHSVTFLSFLLAQSIGAPPHGLLGDEGLLHQAIHSMSIGWPRREPLRAIVRNFESRVPGFTRRLA